MVLEAGSQVGGNLIVRESRGRNFWRDALEIELRGGSTVNGDLIVEDEDREVRLILRDGSAVRGEIRGAEVVRE